MYSEYQHLIDLNDYPVSWWNGLINLGEEIKNNPAEFAHECEGQIMATLFYEPSTRTQMSFQTAMLRLGGRIIGFDNPSNSSVSKGESLKDTTKIVSSYADIMVIRHPMAGTAKAAALTAGCPVINAGDGGHLHPTQTLTDLLTLKIEKGTLSGLTIGMCGDLINGRTVHSLCKALSCYENNKFVFISTPELKLPAYVKDVITAHGSTFEEVDTLEEAIGKLDVLYMTRIQQERFASREEYLAQKDTYVLDRKKMLDAKKDMIVLH
ncbi:MAG: aspartate carbamoyltransferase, partial [Ruminococcus sp.]|nr:aspartate carbamoyltransferase [Ruminococcus sp.]